MSSNDQKYGSEILQEIWAGFIGKVDVPIRSMLRDAKLISFDGNTVIVEVAPFSRDFLSKTERFNRLQEVLRDYLGSSSAKLCFSTPEQRANIPALPSEESCISPEPDYSLPERAVENYEPMPPRESEPLPSTSFAAASQQQINEQVSTQLIEPKKDSLIILDTINNIEITQESITGPIRMSREEYEKTRLREDLTFDSFVRGDTNNIAWSTARSAALMPAQQFNPLFFYSGVGLGKTHLMNAIGNYVLQNDPTKKVLYISAEQFTNELVESIKDSQQRRFRERYRKLDFLLIDDIQFIVTKEKTQEEFFHTFNELHSAKRQIVVSSDRPANLMPSLMDRLRSRLSMGMSVDIQPPDLETRIAILHKKAESVDIDIDPDVFTFIAEQFHSNIRELEGALNRVVIYCRVLNKRVTVPGAKIALNDQIKEIKGQELDSNIIKRIVCQYFDITEMEIEGPSREQRIVKPRQIAMYLCKELTPDTYPKIGTLFGNRDHTTVLHACRQVQKNINDKFTKTSLTNIRERMRI